MPPRVIETNPRGQFPDSSFKYTPFQHLRVLYASFIQGLFKAAPKGFYHWEPSMEDTDLIITDENPINVDSVGGRPSITFTRGPVNFYSLGLDDMMSYDFQTGTKKKSVLIPGTMSINCCSRSDLESEQIAWVVAEHLWLLRDLLMRMGFFEIGRQQSVGSPSPAGSLVTGDSAKEWYATTIFSPFQFYRTSQFTPLAQQVLENISLNLRAAFQPAVPSPSADPLGPSASTAPNLPVGFKNEFPAAFAPDASDVYGGTPNPGAQAQRLPMLPHPLNPAQLVTVLRVRPNRPGVRPPSIGGRTIPITQPAVEESTAHVTDTSTVKV